MGVRQTARGLLGSAVKDLYSAEKQLATAIPTLIGVTKNAVLQAGLAAHLDETRQQLIRLETIAGILKITLSGVLCKVMAALIEDGADAFSANAPSALPDLRLVAVARRVEHYEIAAYRTAIALAEVLKLSDVAALLEESLFEESGAVASIESQLAEQSAMA